MMHSTLENVQHSDSMGFLDVRISIFSFCRGRPVPKDRLHWKGCGKCVGNEYDTESELRTETRIAAD